ncbi:ribonuclease [Sandaracinobacter sp. RS1-74]|uniref:ribonuclease n=1 Tax=Sandaracinobacteroides sayramensis TaxID=2913411 RepID=UPI001EDC50B7|nr:ribonuclease [Sandaracinobacteroides sayramensis]MCG2841925.1 ribonuclease [Sandaracinobacteroides sayramensis]
MADFFLSERLGETRAAVVERFHLVEMHIARDGDGLAAGARLPARLKAKLGQRGIAQADGEELLVEPWPAGATEGATVTLEVTRAAWAEHGRERLAKARPTALAPSPSPGLAAALQARGLARKPGWPPEVADQWDEAFEQAKLGRFAFDSGALQLMPTPAFLAVDVDGPGLSLALPALAALARLIRLWGLGGNIVVDLPAADKAQRTAAAEAFDAGMRSLAFERTAINGFGMLQIVRPRPGPSILERAQLDRAGTEAIELLERALADRGTAPLRLKARAPVVRWLESRPHLLEELGQRSHRAVDLAVDPLSGTGHVETSQRA